MFTLQDLYKLINTQPAHRVEDILIEQYGYLIEHHLHGRLSSSHVVQGLIECFSKQSVPIRSKEPFIKVIPMIVSDSLFLYDYFFSKEDVFSNICLTYQSRIQSCIYYQVARLSGNLNIVAKNELDLLLSETYGRFQRELEKKKSNPPKFLPLLIVLKRHARFAFGQFCRAARRTVKFSDDSMRVNTETPLTIICRWELIEALTDSIHQSNLTEIEKSVFVYRAIDDMTWVDIKIRLDVKNYVSIPRIFDLAKIKIRKHFSLYHHDLYVDLMETL